MATRRNLTPSAEAQARCLAGKTGLDLNVLRAWYALESRWGKSPSAPWNFLNLKDPRTGTWRVFGSNDEGCEVVNKQLHSPNHGYPGILASAGRKPRYQIAAIAASAWSEDHYGGGQNLWNFYAQIVDEAAKFGGDPSLAIVPTDKGPVPPNQAAGGFESGDAPGTLHIPGSNVDLPFGIWLQIAAGGVVLILGLILILAAVGLRSGRAGAVAQELPVVGTAVRRVKKNAPARKKARVKAREDRKALSSYREPENGENTMEIDNSEDSRRATAYRKRAS